MRSRDYECWVADATPSEEESGPRRLEEGAVPLVRKLSDTSRHARVALMLQPGRKYILQWRRTAICGITDAEREDPFITCVWVNIALNGKTLGEGLLSDLNQQTKASLDGISSSTALVGSPLWEFMNGAPAGLAGKLTVSFYRSPEVIRRALKDRTHSEPPEAYSLAVELQSPQPGSVDSSLKSGSLVRRNPLLFRGTANPAPTVFNFFFEVAAEVETTPKGTPLPLRRAVSSNFVFSWSKSKSKKGRRQPSDDDEMSLASDAQADGLLDESPEKGREGVNDTETPASPADGAEDTETNDEDKDKVKDKDKDLPVPETNQVEAEENVIAGRPRAATLKAINGRMVVVADPNQGGQIRSSSTVDTEYVLRNRPRAATVAAPVVPSQRANGMTSAASFLSAVSAFEGEKNIATRPRRALTDAPAQWRARMEAAEGKPTEILSTDVAATTSLVQSPTLREASEPGKREQSQTPVGGASHNSLAPVAEGDWESTRAMSVVYRDSLHQDLVDGQVSKVAVLDSDSDSSSLAESPRLRQDPFPGSVVHPAVRYLQPEQIYPSSDLKAMPRNMTVLNYGASHDTQTSKGSFAHSVGNGRIDTVSGTVDSSHDQPSRSYSTPLSQPPPLRESHGRAITPDIPSPARQQIYEAKRAAIVPLEDTLRALQEEEAALLHQLEVRRLNHYQDSLSKQIEERRLRVGILEHELNRTVSGSSNLDANTGDQDSVASNGTPVSPARSLTSFLSSGKENLETVSDEYNNEPSNDSLVLARHQLASLALGSTQSEGHHKPNADSSAGSFKCPSLPSRPREGSLRKAFTTEESRMTSMSSPPTTPFSPRSAQGGFPHSFPLNTVTAGSSAAFHGVASAVSTGDAGIPAPKPSNFSVSSSSSRALRTNAL